MRSYVRLLCVLLVLSAATACAPKKAPDPAPKQLFVAMLIPGSVTDGGFMQSGHEGLMRIQAETGAKVEFIDKVKPQTELLAGALRDLARRGPDMVIAHGGQCGEAAKIVAGEFPDVRFTVIQGNAAGPNLSSYEVLQEQSAWLAGAAAGLMTKTGKVGHISGIRVTPGLKGRAAFAAGLAHANPKAKLLTTFCGNQDDNALSRKVALAQIKAGADIIFTMLNAGRQGAIDACREKNVRQIGNVKDWTASDPQVFAASAVAGVSRAVSGAGADLAAGNWKAGAVKKIGLEDAHAVRLALAPDVPEKVRARVEELAGKIRSGEIEVSVEYDGPEFTVK
ncbi:MAG: BMP family protein [Thermodesulfobacteriota bacterium]